LAQTGQSLSHKRCLNKAQTPGRYRRDNDRISRAERLLT
jgi:hypothetical protein